MFSHALFLSSGQHCKLCMECLRSCPSRSPRLMLQLPVRDIWRSDALSVEMAPLTIVVALMALLMSADRAWLSAALPHGGWLTGASAATVVLGWLVWSLLVGHEQRAGTHSVGWSARIIFAYAPVAAALLFAFHAGSLPWLHEITIGLASGGGPSVSIALLRLLQVAAGGIGVLMSAWALWMVCRRHYLKPLGALPAWTLFAGVAVAYVAAGLVLLG
jgi:hypothetical protein